MTLRSHKTYIAVALYALASSGVGLLRLADVITVDAFGLFVNAHLVLLSAACLVASLRLRQTLAVLTFAAFVLSEASFSFAWATGENHGLAASAGDGLSALRFGLLLILFLPGIRATASPSRLLGAALGLLALGLIAPAYAGAELWLLLAVTILSASALGTSALHLGRTQAAQASGALAPHIALGAAVYSGTDLVRHVLEAQGVGNYLPPLEAGFIAGYLLLLTGLAQKLKRG